MDDSKKIKISSSFILLKLLFSFLAIYFGKMIYDENKNISEIDFKASLELKIALLVCLFFLVYFFLQPSIYHDDINLYIKKVNGKQTTVSFKNIKSLFNNPLTSKGRSTFSIEYIDGKNEMSSIKFNINYNSKKISDFITKVEKVNPNIEIV